VLGPLVIGNIISKHGISFHCYNTQLNISSDESDEISKLSKLTEYVKDVKFWMTCNFLLLNSDKVSYWTRNLYTESLRIQFTFKEGCTVTSIFNLLLL